MGGQHSSVASKCHGSIIRAFLHKLEPLFMQTNAILTLATGSHCGEIVFNTDEIVFNTDMVGYQEILTAPTSLSEASPNPHDTENLFVGFVVVMREWRG